MQLQAVRNQKSKVQIVELEYAVKMAHFDQIALDKQQQHLSELNQTQTRNDKSCVYTKYQFLNNSNTFELQSGVPNIGCQL